MRHYSPLLCVCLTQEVVRGDAVIVPDLQHQDSWLSKLRLLQRENGFLLLINHFFLQIHKTKFVQIMSLWKSITSFSITTFSC